MTRRDRAAAPAQAGFIGGLHAAGIVGAAAWLLALALTPLAG